MASLSDISNLSNPWKGLSSYSEGEIIYGRDKDIENLFTLITTNQEITILYGQSGIGKTSLLRAGLFPWLRSSHIFPVYVRLGHDETDKSYVGQVIETVEKEAHKYNIKQTDLSPERSAPKSLWEFLHRYDFHTQSGEKCVPMIFFDQFEELFTISSHRNQYVEEFIKDLGNVLNETVPAYLQFENQVTESADSVSQDKTEKSNETQNAESIEADDEIDLVIDLVIEQDGISQFKPQHDFLLAISIREDYIYNLDRISSSIPALKRNRYFLHGLDESGAREVIKYPVKNLVDASVTDKIISECLNQNEKYISPAFLSLLMYNLFERMRQKGLSNITSSLVNESIGDIFYNYYKNSIKGLSENSIDFLEDRLVSAGGFRIAVPVSDAYAAGVTNNEIKQLEDRRLIIRSKRGEHDFIELTHDLLCKEIIKDREERDKVKKARQNKKRTIIFSSLIAITLAIAGIFIWQYVELNKREKAWQLNQSRAVAAQAEQLIDKGNSDLATLLALEVLPKDLNNPDRPYSIEAERALRKSLLYNDAIIHTSAPIRCMDANPNGEVIVSGYDNGNLALWDTKTGLCIWETTEGHNSPILEITFSPNGERIISISHDGIIFFWDAKTGEKIREEKITSESNSILGNVVISPDCKKVVFRNSYGYCLMNLDSGEVNSNLIEDPNYYVGPITFTSDGNQIITGSLDEIIRIFDAETLELISKFNSNGNVDWISFSPQDKKIYFITSIAGYDYEIHIIDIETNKHSSVTLQEDLSSLSSSINCFALNPENNEIATGHLDGSIRVWNTWSGKRIGLPIQEHSSLTTSLKFTSDGNKILSSSLDETIGIWDYNPKLTDKKLVNHFLSSDAITPDGKLLAFIDSTNITIFNSETGKKVIDSIEDSAKIEYVKFSPDGKKISSETEEGTIRIWDIETGKQIGSTIEDHHQKYQTVFFSPDWNLISYYTVNDGFQIHNIITGERLNGGINGLEDYLADVGFEFCPSSKLLATSSGEESNIFIWDLNTGEQICDPIKTPMAGSKKMAFSPDGSKLLYSFSIDNLHIFDLQNHKHIGSPIAGQIPRDYYDIFSPDKKLFLAFAKDEFRYIIKLIEIDTGKVFMEIPLNDNTPEPISCTFNSEGDKIIVCCDTGYIYTYDWKPLQQLIDEQRERFKDRKLTPEERRQYYLE